MYNVALMPDLEKMLKAIVKHKGEASQKDELISEFEKLRFNYNKELHQLRSKYLPDMVDILNKLSSSNL